MNNHNKVKKSISREDELKLINWDYSLADNSTWEITQPIIKTSKYKLKLNNKKEFMKKWTDRKLNFKVTEKLRPVDLWVLYIIQNYTDIENVIDFKRIKIDYNYSDSKLSKVKKPLADNWIIKQDKNWFYYLNPLVWIKSKEIDQELIDLFKDTFEKYGVDINY